VQLASANTLLPQENSVLPSIYKSLNIQTLSRTPCSRTVLVMELVSHRPQELITIKNLRRHRTQPLRQAVMSRSQSTVTQDDKTWQ